MMTMLYAFLNGLSKCHRPLIPCLAEVKVYSNTDVI